MSHVSNRRIQIQNKNCKLKYSYKLQLIGIFDVYLDNFESTYLRIIKNSLYIFCDVCVNLVKCPWSITNTKTLKQSEEDQISLTIVVGHYSFLPFFFMKTHLFFSNDLEFSCNLKMHIMFQAVIVDSKNSQFQILVLVSFSTLYFNVNKNRLSYIGYGPQLRTKFIIYVFAPDMVSGFCNVFIPRPTNCHVYVGWNVIRIHLYIELEQDINTRVIIIYIIHSRIFMARARPYAKQF